MPRTYKTDLQKRAGLTLRTYNGRWRARNRSRVRANKNIWYDEHREEVRAYRAAYRAKHAEEHREHTRRWRRKKKRLGVAKLGALGKMGPPVKWKKPLVYKQQSWKTLVPVMLPKKKRS